MLAFFKRGRAASSQIGVFVTADGVAAAQVSSRGAGKPLLERCIYEKQGASDPFARISSRLNNRLARAVSVLDPEGTSTSSCG